MFPAAQRFAEAPLRAKLSDRQGLYAVAGQVEISLHLRRLVGLSYNKTADVLTLPFKCIFKCVLLSLSLSAVYTAWF